MWTAIQSIAKPYWDDTCTFYKTNKRRFLTLFSIYTFGIISIIRANYSYVDDLVRAAGGYGGYGHGRVLSNFLSMFIHTTTELKDMWDISPFPQLLAIAILSLSSCIVIHLLSENQDFSIWTIIAVLPLGLSPYFLQCISYKFDAPYMACSVLMGTLPFLVRKYGLFPYGVVSLVCSLAMCTTYQAASGIYPMLTALLCFRQWNKGRSIKSLLPFWGTSVFSYTAALLIFKLLVVPNARTYEKIGGFSVIPQNIRSFIFLINYDFEAWWLVLVALIGIAFIYTSVRDATRPHRVLSAVLAAVTLLVTAFMSLGAYLVLEQISAAPRSMIGVSAFIAFIGVCSAGSSKGFPAKLFCLCLKAGSFLFLPSLMEMLWIKNSNMQIFGYNVLRKI